MEGFEFLDDPLNDMKTLAAVRDTFLRWRRPSRPCSCQPGMVRSVAAVVALNSTSAAAASAKLFISFEGV